MSAVPIVNENKSVINNRMCYCCWWRCCFANVLFYRSYYSVVNICWRGCVWFVSVRQV